MLNVNATQPPRGQGLGSTVTKSNTIYDRMVELGALGEKRDVTDDGPDHHHLTSVCPSAATFRASHAGA